MAVTLIELIFRLLFIFRAYAYYKLDYINEWARITEISSLTLLTRIF